MRRTWSWLPQSLQSSSKQGEAEWVMPNRKCLLLELIWQGPWPRLRVRKHLPQEVALRLRLKNWMGFKSWVVSLGEAMECGKWQEERWLNSRKWHTEAGSERGEHSVLKALREEDGWSLECEGSSWTSCIWGVSCASKCAVGEESSNVMWEWTNGFHALQRWDFITQSSLS